MTNIDRKVRTRYAPSPTGFQHVGGIRTAILNYFIARSFDGEFILRIEDTDASRFVPGTEQFIIDTLDWLKIQYKEGPDIGGQFAPYRQSERKDIYQKYAWQLVEEGKAYYAFDTPEKLDDKREQEKAQGKAFSYNYINRNYFSNSLTLSANETQTRIRNGQPFVIRIKLPENTLIRFNDLIRGEIEVHTSELEDRVLLKSDGWPTYHLAHVVDDRLMDITHVIRGEEWLPSAPVHYYLYNALGWQDHRPYFAHLPLVLNPDGQGKLSKRKFRDATTPIFPVSWISDDGSVVKGMREEGFLPEAMLNILVLLGWHSNEQKEIYTRAELEKLVSVSGIRKSGARFDYEKAKWINKQFLSVSDTAFLVRCYTAITRISGLNEKALYDTIELIKSRISVLREIDDYAYLFGNDIKPDVEFALEEKEILEQFLYRLQTLDQWTSINLQKELAEVIVGEKKNIKMVYMVIRKALSGRPSGLDIIIILAILGQQTVLERLNYAIIRK